ncbi:hypothetical protein BCCGELA001_10885 [Bradyrhizobium sp. CCGE-LA001]|nr:hypothetical protein BCCGELA001_10885 [Bradyrhizobium sp. CCGE-LA001]
MRNIPCALAACNGRHFGAMIDEASARSVPGFGARQKKLHSARDHDRLPSDPASLVRGQKQRHWSDLVRTTMLFEAGANVAFLFAEILDDETSVASSRSTKRWFPGAALVKIENRFLKSDFTARRPT